MASNLFKPSMPEDFFSVETDIENVCRICLQSSYTLSSIFRDDIDEMISEFLPNKADLKDNFPHQICRKCLQDVKIAYAFKKQAEYAHEVVKKMLDGKRLPRSSNKKSYQEINENHIYRTKTIPSDFLHTYIRPRGMGDFTCHICHKNLTQKSVLKRHLQNMHQFYDFEKQYSYLFGDSNNTSKQYDGSGHNESYIEEMTFPILPQVIMVDDDNDMQVDERIEDADDPIKSQGDEITEDAAALANVELQKVYDCHICNKRLTRRYYLKCHLEKVHQSYDIDIIKPKLVPLKIKKEKNEVNDKMRNLATPSHKTPKSSSTQSHKNYDRNDDSITDSFECRICRKVLTRRYGLKKHYEIVHNISENEKLLDLTYDGSNDGLDNSLVNTSFDTSKNKSTLSIPQMKKSRTKTVNVYICHICEKEFSGRATMRRHLKNVHKFINFEDPIWLSKVFQKTVETEMEEEEENNLPPIDDGNDQQFDQSYKQDDDIDMHAYLLCPEVVLTTGDDHNSDVGNVKPAKVAKVTKPSNNNNNNNNRSSSNVEASTSNGKTNFDLIDFFEGKNGFKNNNNPKEQDEEEKIKVEPLKLKLDILSSKPIDLKELERPSQKNTKNCFSCKYCEKPFNRYDHLKRHERTHTKPYSCRFCSKGFYRQDLLIRHEKAAHSKSMHKLKRQSILDNPQYHQEYNYNLDYMNPTIGGGGGGGSGSGNQWERDRRDDGQQEQGQQNYHSKQFEDNDNSYDYNENGNYDNDDDDDDDDVDDMDGDGEGEDDDDIVVENKNYDDDDNEEEQNSNQDSSNLLDINKDDSNPETIESSIKDVKDDDDENDNDNDNGDDNSNQNDNIDDKEEDVKEAKVKENINDEPQQNLNFMSDLFF